MRRWVISLAMCVMLCLSGYLAAQSFSGDLGLGYAWQNVSGNKESFRTQEDVDEGFILESLSLQVKKRDTNLFHLQAWGFGGAEPGEHGRVTWDPESDWSVALTYDKRDSFFGLSGSDLTGRRDRWDITRWNGGVRYNGWGFATLHLGFRHVDRNGFLSRPFYGLNNLYPLNVSLDETMDEGTFRMVTKRLPVVLDFEQTLSRYDRTNLWSPGGSTAYDGSDPDLLTDLSTTHHEEQDVPTTRLTASYTGGRVETVLSLFYSSADLDSTGVDRQAFAINGGDIGTMTFMDTLVGSASLDTLTGSYRLGVTLGRGWHLKMSFDYRDASRDAAILGERLLSAANPAGGALDLTSPVDDNTRFDTTDESGKVELEYRKGAWTVWVGGLAGNRDVSWRLTGDAEPVDVSRDTSGFLAGLALNLGSRFKGNLEYEHGSFEEYVFRTDPETVDRVTLRCRSSLGKGFALNLHGRYESADNPLDVANLSRDSSATGLTLVWTPEGGTSTFGVDGSILDLSTDTNLVLPDGSDGLSYYDTGVRRLSAFARVGNEARRLTCRLTWLKDDGDTWPVDVWNASLRLGFKVVDGMRLVLFGQYWSYDEVRADVDDFNVTRYGIAMHWSFK